MMPAAVHADRYDTVLSSRHSLQAVEAWLRVPSLANEGEESVCAAPTYAAASSPSVQQTAAAWQRAADPSVPAVKCRPPQRERQAHGATWREAAHRQVASRAIDPQLSAAHANHSPRRPALPYDAQPQQVSAPGPGPSAMHTERYPLLLASDDPLPGFRVAMNSPRAARPIQTALAAYAPNADAGAAAIPSPAALSPHRLVYQLAESIRSRASGLYRRVRLEKAAMFKEHKAASMEALVDIEGEMKELQRQLGIEHRAVMSETAFVSALVSCCEQVKGLVAALRASEDFLGRAFRGSQGIRAQAEILERMVQHVRTDFDWQISLHGDLRLHGTAGTTTAIAVGQAAGQAAALPCRPAAPSAPEATSSSSAATVAT